MVSSHSEIGFSKKGSVSFSVIQYLCNRYNETGNYQRVLEKEVRKTILREIEKTTILFAVNGTTLQQQGPTIIG